MHDTALPLAGIGVTAGFWYLGIPNLITGFVALMIVVLACYRFATRRKRNNAT